MVIPTDLTNTSFKVCWIKERFLLLSTCACNMVFHHVGFQISYSVAIPHIHRIISNHVRTLPYDLMWHNLCGILSWSTARPHLKVQTKVVHLLEKLLKVKHKQTISFVVRFPGDKYAQHTYQYSLRIYCLHQQCLLRTEYFRMTRCSNNTYKALLPLSWFEIEIHGPECLWD